MFESECYLGANKAGVGDLQRMSLDFWAATDVGRTRDHNEDNFLVARKLNLFVVADGMGGHAAGEVASNVAVHEAHRIIAENSDILDAYTREGGEAEKEAVLELVERSISTACATVFRLAQEDPSKKGMGTTLSLMLILGNRGFIGHVGDSRIYLIRTGSVLQLTEDHSLINELVKRGKIRADEAGQMPFKNAVTRAVGVYEKVEVDAFDIDVLRGDQYLICSDGLSGYFEDDSALLSMAEGDIKTIPDSYIRFANEHGGKDNITAIFVRVTDAVATPVLVKKTQSVVTDSPHIHSLRLEPLFGYCAFSHLKVIAGLAQEHHLKSGEIICEAQASLDGLYLCLDGALQVDGDPRLVEKGASIGMEALLGPIRYGRVVSVARDAKLLYLPGEDLRHAMALDPAFGWRLLFSLGEQQSKQIHALTSALTLVRDEALREGVSTAQSVVPSSNVGLVGAGQLQLDALPSFLMTEDDDAPSTIESDAGPVTVGISDRTTVPRRKGPIGRGLNPK